MTDKHIDQTYYLGLLGFLMSAKQHLVDISGEFGLSGIQAITLLLLNESKPHPMKSFCILYHCDASNITGIIDGLEKKGLVSRQSDNHDRRIKVIQLEEAGKKLQRSIIEKLDASRNSLFDPLSELEIQQLIHILEKFSAVVMPPDCKSQSVD